jgi:hypothetical protein
MAHQEGDLGQARGPWVMTSVLALRGILENLSSLSSLEGNNLVPMR